jgi:Zn-dependent peptidase ImmA (M78 family)
MEGDNLPGFDSALFQAPTGRRGWGIIYDNRIRSRGRINFTLAHEFGHYVLHRSTLGGDAPRRAERRSMGLGARPSRVQANVFATNLLMPLDDYRKQLPASAKVGLDVIDQWRDRFTLA